jgi:hypothetical protein
MTPRDKKMRAILTHAIALWVTGAGSTETMADLAAWLNANGFRSGWGNPYWGGRGVAKLVHCAYDYVCVEMGLGKTGAEPIAMAFTDRHGRHAWDY